jgi:hypothetical protein
LGWTGLWRPFSGDADFKLPAIMEWLSGLGAAGPDAWAR